MVKKIVLAIFVLFLGVIVMFIDWQAFGSKIKGDDFDRVSKSENYDLDKKKFSNQHLIRESNAKSNINFSVVKEWFSKGENRTPTDKLPEVSPDLTSFVKLDGKLKTIWLGHSTFLLNMSGVIVLVDPVFSESASPIKGMVKRFQAPSLTLEQLPHIDVVVISHDHYDHLDMNSIKHFAHSTTQFVVPLGIGSHLKGWGIKANKITERDWWQSTQIKDVTFTATPAYHFSGRGLLDGNSTLWASWVISSEQHNVYFSGDTGYANHFKEIGERFGPFDIAFIESGQYNENWQDVHMLPSEGVQAFKDLKAQSYFPVHWGMFELALHTWFDPVEQLSRFAKQEGFRLLTPKLGQLVNVLGDRAYGPWWHSYQGEVSAESSVELANLISD